MVQAVTINREAVKYDISTKAIIAVLGAAYIYKIPTFDDILKIVFLGLENQHGHTPDSFVNVYRRGEIYTSKKRNQYSMAVTRLRVQARIKQVNREYSIHASLKK